MLRSLRPTHLARQVRPAVGYLVARGITVLLALYVWVHGVPLDLAPRRPDRIEFECRARKWGGWHPDGLPGVGRSDT